MLKELLPKIPYGVVFRGEYLNSTKHNVLCYSRVPLNHIIIYDATSVGEESEFANPARRLEMATALGLETVPILFDGTVEDPNHLRLLLDKESVLGGQKIEGVVIKPRNYDLRDRDKKVLMGKFVSEHFRETHSATWKLEHGKKSGADIIAILGDKYQTQARWQKALIHLKEVGNIENSPRDICPLMAEVPIDVQKDCEADIRDALWAWAWPQLRRKVTDGLPEWYKDLIMKESFNEATATTEPVAPLPVPLVSAT